MRLSPSKDSRVQIVFRDLDKDGKQVKSKTVTVYDISAEELYKRVMRFFRELDRDAAKDPHAQQSKYL